MTETYLFSLDYFNESVDENFFVYGAIGAENLIDAMKKISARFPNINNVKITELFADDGFVFLEKEEYMRILKEETEEDSETSNQNDDSGFCPVFKRCAFHQAGTNSIL